MALGSTQPLTEMRTLRALQACNGIALPLPLPERLNDKVADSKKFSKSQRNFGLLCVVLKAMTYIS
jgi:hypothetical protein